MFIAELSISIEFEMGGKGGADDLAGNDSLVESLSWCGWGDDALAVDRLGERKEMLAVSESLYGDGSDRRDPNPVCRVRPLGQAVI